MGRFKKFFSRSKTTKTTDDTQQTDQTQETQQLPPEEANPTLAAPHNATQDAPAELPDPAIVYTVEFAREQLWSKAYKVFSEKNPDLAKDYKRHIVGDDIVSNSLSPPPSMEALGKKVTDFIDVREAKQWNISISGKNTINVRSQVEKLAKFLTWSNGIVKDALSSQPYAALAWSGVSLLIPLLSSGAEQHEAMITGFASISDVQLYWASCEETFLSFQDHYKDLETPLSQLYALVIEYQALAICHLSQKQLSRAWEKATGAMDWKAKETKIKANSEQCKSFIGLGQQREIRDHNAKQLSLMESSYTVQKRILQTMQEVRQEDLEMQIQHHLIAAAPTYAADKDFNPMRVSGTCEWFLNDSRFKNWRDHTSSSLLWVSAAPGCGKSVLSRTLVDEGHLNTSTTTIEMNSPREITANSTESTVCYFFFKEGDGSRQRSNAALCAMLHQVFSNDVLGSRIKHAMPSHRSFGKSLTLNFSELWNILVQCASGDEETGDLFCVFDALDECSERSRKDLIAKLSDFYLQNDRCKSHRLKVLITSRPYDDIETLMRQFSQHAAYMRLDGGDKIDRISEEINLVIDAKVDEFARNFEPHDRLKIANHLKQMGTRTYLTLHLIINIIEQSPSDYSRGSDVEELLSGLPLEITDAYENILSRVKSPQKTAALLQILLAATRPLTLEEANYVLTIALAKKRFGTFEAVKAAWWPEQEFKKVVRNLSGLLVDVYDGKLSFIHLTAREFLITNDCQHDENKWKGRFSNSKRLQALITRCCMDYMMLSDLPRRIISLRWDVPFYEYAGSKWLYHYSLQDKESRDENYKDLKRLCSASGPEIYTWGYGKLFRRHCWTDLAIASYLNLDQVAKRLVEDENHEVDAWCGFFGTPLQAACAAGHEKVVKVLVQCGADVNTRTGFHGDALQAAAACGYLNICEFLVAQGASINAVGGRFGSAFRAAVFLGHLDVVKFLLNNGANFDVSEDIIMAGFSSVYYGKNITTELLEICGDKLVISDTLLQYAAGRVDNVDESVIQALLEADTHRVEVTEEVLYHAIKDSNVRIVKLLVQHRTDESPLTERLVVRAAENGDEDIFWHVVLNSVYRSGECPISEDVLIATAKNETSGQRIRGTILLKYKVRVTAHAIEQLASRAPPLHLRLMLNKCQEKVEIKPEALIAGIENGAMDYNEVHDLLTDADFPTSKVTVDTIELAAGTLSGREMSLLLTLSPDKNLAVTQHMIMHALANMHYGSEVLEVLLRSGEIKSRPQLSTLLWQNTLITASYIPEILDHFFTIFTEVTIPDEIIVSAIQQEGPRALDAVVALLNKRGNPMPVQKMINAAVINAVHGVKFVYFFLTEYRRDVRVKVQPLKLDNLNNPEICIDAVRAALLNSGDDIPVTQDVLKAALRAPVQSMKLFQMFFELCPEKVVVTDELMGVAARAAAGSVIALWLERRCIDTIPEKWNDVLKLAYAKKYGDEYGIAQLEKKGVSLD